MVHGELTVDLTILNLRPALAVTHRSSLEAKDAAQRSGCFDRRLVEIFFAQARSGNELSPRGGGDRKGQGNDHG